MNCQSISTSFTRCARIAAAICAAAFLIFTADAQPPPNTVSSRYLLVFDTSSAMKKRVTSTQYAVERLFFSMMNGQLQPGDTIGVWAFDRTLRAGDFPLQHWAPQNAATIASNITNFVRLQRYRRSARFDAIMPDVSNLVRSSERLTVLIFCDGDAEIKGTPFDGAINTIFKKNQRALEKADQAFIIVLRSQLGQYVGYTVNSSAIGVNLPEFPPLPAPPQPAASVETNPPVKAKPSPPKPGPPIVEAPPLVIIGTNVSTNLVPQTPPKTVPTNPPPAKVESNAPPPVESATIPTNIAVPPKMAATQTNSSAPSEEKSGLSRDDALEIGAGLLVVAVALISFALLRSRRADRGSLISRSMKKK
jgi:hypothetical protein